MPPESQDKAKKILGEDAVTDEELAYVALGYPPPGHQRTLLASDGMPVSGHSRDGRSAEPRTFVGRSFHGWRALERLILDSWPAE